MFPKRKTIIKIIFLSGILLLCYGLWLLTNTNLQVFSRISNNFSRILPVDFTLFSLSDYIDIYKFYFGILISLTGLILFFFPKKIQFFFKSLIGDIFRFFVFFKQLPKDIKLKLGLILLVNFIVKLFLVITRPVFTDEAWTYWLFSQNDVLTSMSFYPAPNNHILHSILTNVSVLLPIDLLIALRLPNFFITLMSVLVFFVLFSKLFRVQTALILTGIFSFGFAVMYYSYVARGYMLYLLAFLVLFYITVQSLKNRNFTKKKAVWWFVVSIIGFWTIPAFLYPYFSSFIFLVIFLLIIKNRQALYRFLFVNLAVAFGVLLVYAPVLMVSGIRSLVGNPYVSPLSRLSVIRNFDENFEATTNLLFNLPLTVSFMLFVFVSYFLHKNKKFERKLMYAYFLVFMSPVLMLTHSVVPMPRIWIYWLVPVFYILGIVLEQLFLTRLEFKHIYIGMIGIILIQIFVFFYKLPAFDSESIYAQKLSTYLKQQRIRNLYIDEDAYLGTNILFEFKRNERPLNHQFFFRKIDSPDISKFDFFLLRPSVNEQFVKKNYLKLVKFDYGDYQVNQFLYKNTN